ncbi:hypothetical protein C8J57DRAFT_1722246 [Mycena rebaudengoi]|nr:hypothetical protein C8J57DRAFT_1722246 [Mycena rebaudengoi]
MYPQQARIRFQILALQDEYMTKGYRRRSPGPPSTVIAPTPIFRHTLPLTCTSLPLSRDAARGRASPLSHRPGSSRVTGSEIASSPEPIPTAVSATLSTADTTISALLTLTPALCALYPAPSQYWEVLPSCCLPSRWVLRSDHEWAPHITATTPIFRDAVTLHRPRIFALAEEEREETRPPPQPPPSSVTPVHLVHPPRRSRRCSSLPALPPPRTHPSPTTGLPRPSALHAPAHFFWSSAIHRAAREGAIELLVEGRARDSATRARRGGLCVHPTLTCRECAALWSWGLDVGGGDERMSCGD